MMFQSREKASQKYADIIVRKLEATALDAVVFYYGKIHASADEYSGEFCYSDDRIRKKEIENAYDKRKSSWYTAHRDRILVYCIEQNRNRSSS